MGEGKKFKEFERKVARISDYEPELELESDEELRARYDALRERVQGGESLDEVLFESFAVTREAAKRTLGQRHFDVQLIGGMVLHDGSIAEMKTGEGKTLTSTLPIALNALASRDAEGNPVQGRGVHLVTVNDYLARRDALWMKPIYDLLGITVGILQSDSRSFPEKRAAYEADVTYGTNSEFGFDYLRDNLATDAAEKAQRGHGFAIVDEVDNILIDEARTPLIISGAPEQAADLYYQFAKLAPQLEAGKKPEGIEAKSKEYVADFDFEPDEKHKTVAITERGVEKAERFLRIDNMYKAEHGNLVNHLQQALKAESLYKRGVDYEVIDGEVKIIDEFTGRILEGRRWSEGLHQAVEAKEGVAIQEENQTVATITYQNYFRRYDKLAGMTGTALTEATEFMKIYELQVVEVPTNSRWSARTTTTRSTRPRTASGPRWSARSSAATRRGSRCWWARSRSRSRSCSRGSSRSAASSTRCSTPSPSTPSARARPSPRPAAPARSRSPPTWPAAAWTSSWAATPSTITDLELQAQGLEPGSPEYDKAWDQRLPEIEAQVERAREQVMEAGGLYILGTERHESRRIDNQLRGRSGPPGRPRRVALLPLGGGRPRAPVRRRPDLPDPRSPRAHRRGGRGGADRGQDALQADRGGPEEGRGAELPDPQARPRVRRRDEPAARDHLRVPRQDPRGRGHVRHRARPAAAGRGADGRGVPGGRLPGELGPGRPLHPARADVPGGHRLRRPRPRRPGPPVAHRRAARRHRRRLRRPRGGARRRAHARARAVHAAPDHRRALARAPARHGLPARGHPPARVRADRPARGLQERGLRHVHGAHERHLGGVRALHLRRGGRGGGRERRGRPAAAAELGRRLQHQLHRRLLVCRRHRRGPAQRAGRGPRRRRVPEGVQGAADMAAEDMEVPLGPMEPRTVDERDRIGRNDPCWCGSGKKFKKCHGA